MDAVVRVCENWKKLTAVGQLLCSSSKAVSVPALGASRRYAQRDLIYKQLLLVPGCHLCRGTAWIAPVKPQSGAN